MVDSDVIYGLFDDEVRAVVLKLHRDPSTGSFLSANDIAKVTSLRLSVVRSILRRFA